jgi:hypothetical protein
MYTSSMARFKLIKATIGEENGIAQGGSIGDVRCKL